jgi:glyoxylase-like metal-dependent hydrolase (beta-lactamase superfamily II)
MNSHESLSNIEPSNTWNKRLNLAELKQGEEYDSGLVRIVTPSHRLTQSESSLFGMPTENRAVVFIDTGNDPRARTMRLFMGSLGLDFNDPSAQAGVILTHSHEDHTQGIRSMRDVAVYAHPLARRTLKELGLSEGFLPYAKDTALVIASRFDRKKAPATWVFPRDLRPIDDEVLDLGGINFRIFKAPGHTSDSIAVLINDRDLVVGDAFGFTKAGEVALTPPVFSKDSSEAKKSVSRVYQKIGHLGLKNIVVHPAHTGSGTWEAVGEFCETKKINPLRKIFILSRSI